MESSPGSEPRGYVVHAAGVGIWAWDVVNDVLTTDQRCEEILAMEPGNVLFRAAALADGDFDYERCLSGADGDSRWVRLSGRAMSDEAGQVVHCVGVMREVTAEHRLRESEERLR